MTASNGRRFMTGAVAIAGAGAVGLAMAAPAGAAVTGVEITTPSGFGSASGVYGTGCTYEVAATVNNYGALAPNLTITARLGNGPEKVLLAPTKPTKNVVTANWKPADRGTYTITATQTGTAAKTTTAKVGTGLQLPDLGPINLSSSGACLIIAP